jgi:glycosyltransferase involved in cell wall biosynthesis
MTLISIITINYNDSSGLESTIQSVIKQSYLDLEYIVIDGNGKDNSKEIIEEYASQITYWTSEPDTGIYNAMNKGIRKSKGEYLLFLNSGDTLRSDTIIEEVAELIKDNVDIYYGSLAIQQNGKETIREYPVELTFNYFFYMGHLPHPASFIKRSLFDTFGLYKEKFKIVADWDFYVNAICKFQCSYKNLLIVITNFEPTGISSKPETRELLLQEKEMSLKDNFRLFYEDYEHYQILKQSEFGDRSNPIKQIEHHKFARKIHSLFLKLLVMLFRKKNNEEIKKNN